MKLFCGISELLTLQGAWQKQGRHINEQDLDIGRRAAILEDQGRIVWVGEEKKLARFLRENKISNKKIKKIDLQGACVLPGMIDCHTHLIFAGNRQNEFEMRNQGATYQEIASQGGGIRSTVAATRKASPRVLAQLAEARLKCFLDQGVTTVEVKSGYGLSHSEEIKILRVAKTLKTTRVVPTYLGPHALPAEGTADQYIDEIINRTLPEIRRLKLADRVDMFVESGYYTLAQARQYFSRAQELGFSICGHTDQLTRTGASVLLAQMNAKSVDHFVQISSGDIAQIAQGQSVCVALPTSDLYLRMSYPPAREILRQGGRVALSTDFNPGTSPSQDVSLVGVLARLEMKMTLPEVICGWTYSAAAALGQENQLGSLQKGHFCDLSVLSDGWQNLFYGVGYHPVRATVISGNLKKS